MKTKLSILGISVLAFLLAVGGSIQAQTKEVKTFCKELEKKPYWLKVDVLTVQRQYTVQDVTNIFSNGEVSYRGRVGKDWTEAEQTQAPTAQEFAAVVRQKTKDDVQILQRGSAIMIDYAEPRKDQVKVGVKGKGKSKGAIWLKIEKKDYTVEDLQKSLKFAFAESESELKGAATTVEIQMGMSVEDVMKAKGNPKSKVNLGSKTILTYDDMKMIFEDNKLVDVQ